MIIYKYIETLKLFPSSCVLGNILLNWEVKLRKFVMKLC